MPRVKRLLPLLLLLLVACGGTTKTIQTSPAVSAREALCSDVAVLLRGLDKVTSKDYGGATNDLAAAESGLSKDIGRFKGEGNSQMEILVTDLRDTVTELKNATARRDTGAMHDALLEVTTALQKIPQDQRCPS